MTRSVDAIAGLNVERDGDVAIVQFDAPHEKVNKLSTAWMTRFQRLIDALSGDRDVAAIVLMSAKRDSFVVGADLDEIAVLSTSAEAAEKATFGQRVFAGLEALGKPVVAAVHGACLGGGCELVLACHWRILSDDPATRIGLPEVRLGIIPGFGGTQRLPRIVGLQAALDLILSGKAIDARRALRIGLADKLVYPALLRDDALRAARTLVARGRPNSRRRSRYGLLSVPGFLDRTAVGRALVFRTAERRVRRETRGHYPAPLAALESVRLGMSTHGGAYAREAALLGDMAMTSASRNLLHIFRSSESIKKSGRELPEPLAVQQLGIVGAGVMGGGIAHLAASKNIRVRLKDIARAPLSTALVTASALLRRDVERHRLTALERDNKLALISTALDYSGFRLCNVVVEAVVEKMDVKQAVLRELEKHVHKNCVLATNTSALSVRTMAEVLRDPTRVVGMHFFNPVHRMPLVEVVVTPETHPLAVSTILKLARTLGKTPIVVHDGPGFLVNRILAPYMNESSRLFEEGQDLEHIEAAMRGFGMPMGPFELLDEVGADVAGKVGAILHAGLGERMQPTGLPQRLVQDGRLGRKTGAGLYRYRPAGGQKGRPDRAYWRRLQPTRAARLSDDVIRDRVFGLMLNEAVRCLDEGIVASATELDLALVYGVGFPPYRGGLLREADSRGLDSWVARLQHLAQQCGARFAPCPRLMRMAAANERFSAPGAAAPPRVPTKTLQEQ